MFGKLEVLQTAQAMARHSAARQTLISENIAQADTPGFRARDLVPFDAIYDDRAGEMRATRDRHFGAEDLNRPVDRPGELSPNGNTVSLEIEMVEAAEVQSAHSRAVTIYSKGLELIRASLGRIR